MSTNSATRDSDSAIDLSTPRAIHLVGIGGAGMSAIADVLLAQGHTVTGSDLTMSRPAQRLAEQGATVFEGHNKANVGDIELVAHSTAIPADNPELVIAQERGIPVLRRAELLAAMTSAWRSISVAGTHGKTTTTAMLTVALQAAGFDPAYIVGGDVVDLGHGAGVGTDRLLVVEADESDGTFIELDSFGVIVTNVEPDHIEFYGDFDRLRQAFVQFVAEAPGPRVICIDDPGARELAVQTPTAITYGQADDARWQITSAAVDPDRRYAVSVTYDDQEFQFSLAQPGMHNALNATAALAMATALGAEPTRVAEGLTKFAGVGRRFERRGSVNGIDFVDDYSHLPTETAAAISAAGQLGADRVVGVFQPHRYSRTQQLWDTFGDAFVGLDVLFITGIYSSGEAPRPGITGELVAQCVRQAHPHADVRYVEELADVPQTLAAELRPGDLCLTMGAGDLTKVPDAIIAAIEASSTEGNA